MSRARLVVGLIACLVLVLSSGAHSIYGWSQLSAQLAPRDLPADLLQSLGIGWRWGGLAMIAFGVTSAWELLRARRSAPAESLACAPIVTGVTYILFGLVATAVSRSPFFLVVFVLPGSMLLFAGWPRRTA